MDTEKQMRTMRGDIIRVWHSRDMLRDNEADAYQRFVLRQLARRFIDETLEWTWYTTGTWDFDTELTDINEHEQARSIISECYSVLNLEDNFRRSFPLHTCDWATEELPSRYTHRPETSGEMTDDR